MAKISAKDSAAAEKHIKSRVAEKTAPRKPLSEAKWTPPAGPGPGSDKEVDRELRRIMKPNPPRQ
jgi:hypothetical protein